MADSSLFLCSNMNCGKEIKTGDQITYGKWRGKNITLCKKCGELLDKTLGFTNPAVSSTLNM